MSRTSSGPEWSGDMLTKPEMVEAFSTQLRGVLKSQAAFVAEVRQEAEAMWKANRPEGYSSFEAWWRHRWVVGPFREIQEHLEEAAKLTFDLEARYRKGRHEIPAARQAAALEKKQAKQAPQISGGSAAVPPKPVEPPTAGSAPRDFLELVNRERSA
ncbi:hypothetical protein RND61_30670 [Streptomyces sp. TRM76323]|uniref:Uncharacterized protein n=1 Tax=Streptomyces tamarix TaxID=3078565 RepID=A0ABU3QUK9_9ACTN|nr:hypothetical protein [Streptomyces tamarix]MDT9686402.1 hypothetical protein [Streptomyces tamarix]